MSTNVYLLYERPAAQGTTQGVRRQGDVIPPKMSYVIEGAAAAPARPLRAWIALWSAVKNAFINLSVDGLNAAILSFAQKPLLARACTDTHLQWVLSHLVFKERCLRDAYLYIRHCCTWKWRKRSRFMSKHIREYSILNSQGLHCG